MNIWNKQSVLSVASLGIKLVATGFVCFVVLLGITSKCEAFICGGADILLGMAANDVATRCGEPVMKEQWRERYTFVSAVKNSRAAARSASGKGKKASRAASGFGSGQRVEEAAIEEWIYNLGPGQPLQFLRFENGELKRVETGRAGFSGRTPPLRTSRSCQSPMPEGARKIEVLMMCGEPTTKALTRGSRKQTGATLDPQTGEEAGVEMESEVVVETWTYELRSNRSQQAVVFENGRVALPQSQVYKVKGRGVKKGMHRRKDR